MIKTHKDYLTARKKVLQFESEVEASPVLPDVYEALKSNMQIYEKKIKRTGNWMNTYSGGLFWLLDPRPEDIYLEDIAHALSLICRFNGHVKKFYSVAQHSVEVSKLVPEKYAVYGLMHDASEALVGDVIRPLKILLGDVYGKIEDKIMNAIAEKFHFTIDDEGHHYIKEADNLMLRTEMRDLTRYSYLPGTTLSTKVKPLLPVKAKKLFLSRCKELGINE